MHRSLDQASDGLSRALGFTSAPPNPLGARGDCLIRPFGKHVGRTTTRDASNFKIPFWFSQARSSWACQL